MDFNDKFMQRLTYTKHIDTKNYKINLYINKSKGYIHVFVACS